MVTYGVVNGFAGPRLREIDGTQTVDPRQVFVIDNTGAGQTRQSGSETLWSMVKSHLLFGEGGPEGVRPVRAA